MPERDEIVTSKELPVLVGENYEHVMAKGVIEQKSAVRSPTTNQVLKEEEVTITIKATGPQARTLGDFVASNEIVALGFSYVPVYNHTKENN